MSFECPKFESGPKSHIEIEKSFEDFFPKEFLNNPADYFEKEGQNIKQGEKKFDETGRLREDPTAVKDLPVWKNQKGEQLFTVAKRINIEKGKVGESGDPFYEYKIMQLVKEKGLPVANPIAKIEQGGTHLIIMEKIQGIRWSEKDALNLREKGYTDEDIESLKKQAEDRMNELKEDFEKAGIKRGWKLKDLIFDIDIENKKILKITPTDWERTKIVKE